MSDKKGLLQSAITFKQEKSVVYYQIYFERFDETIKKQLTDKSKPIAKRTSLLNRLVCDAYLKNRNNLTSQSFNNN